MDPKPQPWVGKPESKQGLVTVPGPVTCVLLTEVAVAETPELFAGVTQVSRT
jgi:hypothetical protein